MKIFEITSKSGTKFGIGVDEEFCIREYLNDYTKELRVVTLKVDGVEVPKDKYGKLFLCEFGYAPHEGKNKLVVNVKYDAFKFIKKLKNLPGKQESAAILGSQELSDYYHDVFIPAADAKIEQLKVDKAAAVQAAFDALSDDSTIEVHYHTSYGHSVQGEYGKHEWFTSCFTDLKRAKLDIPDNFITESDYGDYSISYTYKLSFSELKKLYQAAREILEPQEKQAAEEKAARETLKASLNCEIIKKGKTQGEELDPYALVRLTDPKTRESLEFNCRNIFDFGYVVNPNYEIVTGYKGGIAYQGRWDVSGSDGRELTEFERRCIEYLEQFPPISKSIRM